MDSRVQKVLTGAGLIGASVAGATQLHDYHFLKGTVKKTGKFKVSLGFSNAEMRQRALFNQVLNKPERPFFGFNDRTEKAIKKSFNRFVEKEIKRSL